MMNVTKNKQRCRRRVALCMRPSLRAPSGPGADGELGLTMTERPSLQSVPEPPGAWAPSV